MGEDLESGQHDDLRRRLVTESRFANELWRYRVTALGGGAIQGGIECHLYGACRLSSPCHRARTATLQVSAVSIFLNLQQHTLSFYHCKWRMILRSIMLSSAKSRGTFGQVGLIGGPGALATPHAFVGCRYETRPSAAPPYAHGAKRLTKW